MTESQKDKFFKLLDACTREIVPAIRVTTPPDFPPGAEKAMRFLLEKHMEHSGVSMEIFFVPRGSELETSCSQEITGKLAKGLGLHLDQLLEAAQDTA